MRPKRYPYSGKKKKSISNKIDADELIEMAARMISIANLLNRRPRSFD